MLRNIIRLNGKGACGFCRRSGEAVRFDDLFEPVDEDFHFGLNNIRCVVEADVDNNESHVVGLEVACGVLPKAGPHGEVIAEVVDTTPAALQFSVCIVGSFEYIGDKSPE